MTRDPLRARADVEVLVTDEPLDLSTAYAAVTDPTCGGIALFVGAVRNHHEGEAVAGLEYEAWEERVEGEIHAAARSVLDDHPGVRAVYVAHRLGWLDVGEASVIVAASAPHRDEAFRAARALIDRVKEHAPIWKREELVEGGERWPGTDV